MHPWSILALAGAASAQVFSNPVRQNGADPHMVTLNGMYYLTNTQGGLISVTRSNTMSGLAGGETRTVWTDGNPDRSQNMWAPEMHLIDGMYVFPDYPSLHCHVDSA